MFSVSPKLLQSGGKNFHFHYHRVGGWAIPQAHTEPTGGNPSIYRGSKHSRSARSQVVVLKELSRLRQECRAYTDVTTQLQYTHPALYLQDKQTLIVPTQTVPLNVNQSRYWPGWPRGFQEIKVPRFHDNGTGK